MIISAVTACHSNARSRRITGVKPKRFNMSGGPYGGKSSLATVRVHRLARAPPRTGKYLDIATDRSVPRSLASSVHARRRGRGRTRLRSGDGHLHRPGTSRAGLSSPSARILGCSPSRARGPPTDRREGPRDDSRVSQRSSLRKSRRGRIRPLTSPSLPDLSPRAVQKVSTAAVDVPARAVPAVTHRA